MLENAKGGAKHMLAGGNTQVISLILVNSIKLIENDIKMQDITGKFQSKERQILMLSINFQK